jgi:NAD(P)-dependent dehydrogenase (short-subunit alcohol dehydrogenase family)
MKLSGKTAIVTGGAVGQGQEVARTFAAEGAVVIIIDIDPAGAAEAAEQIRESGGQASCGSFDVSDEAAWADFAAGLAARQQTIDVLYNNAAIFPPDDGGIRELSAGTWDRIMGVNARGVFLGCKHTVPFMTGGGSIVNVSSIRAWLGTTVPQHAYATSKGAVIALTRSLAVELAPAAIRVNAICPGTIETPMARAHDADARQLRIARYPLGRFGLPSDVAPLATFLAGDDSSWITGSVMTVDGGTSALYV